MGELTKLRKRALLTTQDLAEKMETSRQTIYMWERGQTWPKPEHIKKLAEVLGVSTHDVVDALELDRKERPAA